MTILAIDPGLNTGIALSNGFTHTMRFSTKDDIAASVCRLGHYLKDLSEKYNVEKIIVERPFFPPRCKGAVIDLTNALIFETHRQGYTKQIERKEYNSMTVRKELLGKGRRSKGQSVKEFDAEIKFNVCQRGFNPANEHEADAAALICAYHKVNHCEGLSLTTDAPHNGSLPKGKSKNERNRKL